MIYVDPAADAGPSAPEAAEGSGRSRDRRLRTRLVVVAGILAVVVAGGMWASGGSRGGQAGEGALAASGGTAATSGGHDHGGAPISREALSELRRSGYERLPGPDSMWVYQADAAASPLDGQALLQEVRDVVASKGWDRLTEAEDDGFARISPISDRRHYFNRANLDDGVFVDPERPESLVYSESGDLLAVMFMTPVGEHGAPVAGVLAGWHVHAISMCFGADLMMPESYPTGTTCPAGQTYAPWSSEMLHVWLRGEPFSQRMSE